MSIQDFVQIRLLKFSKSEPEYEQQPELKKNGVADLRVSKIKNGGDFNKYTTQFFESLHFKHLDIVSLTNPSILSKVSD